MAALTSLRILGFTADGRRVHVLTWLLQLHSLVLGQVSGASLVV